MTQNGLIALIWVVAVVCLIIMKFLTTKPLWITYIVYVLLVASLTTAYIIIN